MLEKSVPTAVESDAATVIKRDTCSLLRQLKSASIVKAMGASTVATQDGLTS